MAWMRTLLLFYACLCCIAGRAAEGPITLRLTANHWEPYTGAALASQGIASEIVATALARAGYATEISIMPWSRALATTASGKADGIVAIWSTRGRRDQILFSDSYLSNDLFLFYTRPELSDINTLEALAGLRVGIGRDYDYSDKFLLHKEFKADAVDSVVQNLRKLSMGRVDMLIEDKRIVDFTFRHNAGELRHVAPPRCSAAPLFVLPLYFGMSRHYPHAEEVIAAFNLQLRRMQRDGSLSRILGRSGANGPPP